ncbi:MAG: PIN domain-containing protein [Acidimicrobiia bacterium]|nr:PIN domain-containing protein [Acidimicrobiia bacterium]
MKFADTSWWAAWALRGDRRHGEALASLQQVGRSEQILTTNLVAGETWTFLRRKDSHRTALAFIERLDALTSAGRLVVHRVTEDQETAAWEWLRRHDERGYSFVDATSFRVMRDRRLREALAFDHDFAAAGFVEVRPG